MKLRLFIAILSGAAVLLWPRPAHGRRHKQTEKDGRVASDAAEPIRLSLRA